MIGFILVIPIALITLAVLMLIRDLVSRRSLAVQRRLGSTTTVEEPELPRLPMASDLAPSTNPIGRFEQWFGGLVHETGLGLTPEAGFLVAVCGGLVAGGAVFLWQELIETALPAALAGTSAVIAYFYYRRAQRRTQIQEQLPEVMELLARAVRAGESLDQAISLVGDTAEAPLGPEFRRMSRQLDMGLSMDSAVRALTRRAPLTEIRILAATLMVQRHAGGNLPITLERLVKVIRDRISYHRQFKASTAAGRVSTTIIALAAPLVALYMWIFQREYILKFLESNLGFMLLIVGVILQVLGLLWIFFLLRSDY